ncbi:hypothetical protein AB6A40_006517 [Gnathostoma spinigerum]|uniref:Uncharacterized protein n=1 Tax=Gnathostoma spinigerum TaxID=75299 RepID=A0ABD6EIL1_9BILA
MQKYSVLFIVVSLYSLYYSTSSAPAVCRTCTGTNCTTVVEDDEDLDLPHRNRTKRHSSIQQIACTSFQLELVLIPLSIALIPVGLCALLFCALCCGPEDSRGKLPNSLSLRKSNSTKEVDEKDDIELVCKDGIVQRKDSKKTRFKTEVSFIETRRISIDISDERALGLANARPSLTPEGMPKIEELSAEDIEKDKLPRRTNSKRAHFADTVSIIGEPKSDKSP